MNEPEKEAFSVSPLAYLNNALPIGSNFAARPFAVIGETDGRPVGRIGANVSVGSYTLIAQSATIGNNVLIDAFCRIGSGSIVGESTQVLYGAQIFADCAIGSNCVIAGEIPNRVTIEDNVTFMGQIAHSYRDATIPWNSIEEPSPKVSHGSVVGMHALLVGPIVIGPRAYVAAGEIVRFDVPADMVLYKGELTPIASWRGIIRAREAQ